MLLSLRCTSLFHQHNLTHAKQGQDKVLCIYCIITQQLLVFFCMFVEHYYMFVHTKSSHVYTIKTKKIYLFLYVLLQNCYKTYLFMLKNEIFMFVHTKSPYVYTINVKKSTFFCTFYCKIIIKHIFLC